MMWKLAGLFLAASALAGSGYACFRWGETTERLAWVKLEGEKKLAATVAAEREDARRAVVSQRTAHEVETARAAGRADAMRHVAGLLAQRNRPAGNLPVAAETPAEPARADQAAELDDAIACADAVTTAEGWQSWWREIVAE